MQRRSQEKAGDAVDVMRCSVGQGAIAVCWRAQAGLIEQQVSCHLASGYLREGSWCPDIQTGGKNIERKLIMWKEQTLIISLVEFIALFRSGHYPLFFVSAGIVTTHTEKNP